MSSAFCISLSAFGQLLLASLFSFLAFLIRASGLLPRYPSFPDHVGAFALSRRQAESLHFQESNHALLGS